MDVGGFRLLAGLAHSIPVGTSSHDFLLQGQTLIQFSYPGFGDCSDLKVALQALCGSLGYDVMYVYMHVYVLQRYLLQADTDVHVTK